MNPILAPWLAECVILSARSIKGDHRPPLPSEFVATFVIFGTASLIATKSPQVATVFSWGIVTATLLNLWDVDGKLRLNRPLRAGEVPPMLRPNAGLPQQPGVPPLLRPDAGRSSTA